MSCAGGVSAYLPIVCMRSRRLFDSFYTFEGAAPGDFATWRDAMLWFFKKVMRGAPTELGCNSCPLQSLCTA